MIFDILSVIILGFFLYKGYTRGFLQDTFNLVKYFIIIYIIYKFRDDLPKINNYMENKYQLNEIFLYIISFILLFVVLTVLVKIITKFIDVVGMGFLNKLLGLIVAIIKTALLVYIIYIILVLLSSTYLKVQYELNNSNVAKFIEMTDINDRIMLGRLKDPYNRYIEKKKEYKLSKYILEEFESKED